MKLRELIQLEDFKITDEDVLDESQLVVTCDEDGEVDVWRCRDTEKLALDSTGCWYSLDWRTCFAIQAFFLDNIPEDWNTAIEVFTPEELNQIGEKNAC